MTYNVSMGTLNPTIPYLPSISFLLVPTRLLAGKLLTKVNLDYIVGWDVEPNPLSVVYTLQLLENRKEKTEKET